MNELHFLKTQWMRLGELEHSFTQVLQANQGTLEMVSSRVIIQLYADLTLRFTGYGPRQLARWEPVVKTLP